MKVYKVSFLMKMSYALFSIFIIFFSILIIFDNRASIILKLMVPLGVIIAIGGSYALFSLKVGIDEKKLTLLNTIDIRPLFLGKKIQRTNPSLRWDEIGELHTNYILFPETANVILKPKEGLNKRRIEFIVGVGGMPIELVRDILSHLPPDTKVYLYPYLKRKLEGKQTWFYRK